MVNFRVRDLDAMVTQLREAGVHVEVDSQTYPNGRFARLHDPEGYGIPFVPISYRPRPTRDRRDA